MVNIIDPIISVLRIAVAVCLLPFLIIILVTMIPIIVIILIAMIPICAFSKDARVAGHCYDTEAQKEQLVSTACPSYDEAVYGSNRNEVVGDSILVQNREDAREDAIVLETSVSDLSTSAKTTQRSQQKEGEKAVARVAPLQIKGASKKR